MEVISTWASVHSYVELDRVQNPYWLIINYMGLYYVYTSFIYLYIYIHDDHSISQSMSWEMFFEVTTFRILNIVQLGNQPSVGLDVYKQSPYNDRYYP
jgi:hypothetical protein